MNFNNFAIYDFETGSVNPYHTQPLQLACVIVDARRLEILEDDIFSSLIQPIFDEEECKKYNLNPISEEALQVNKIKREELETASPIKTVWEQFCTFINQYNSKGNKWTRPIRCGHNIYNFDDIILDRIAAGNNIAFKTVSSDLKTQVKNQISHLRSDPSIQNKQLTELFRLVNKVFKGEECWGFGPSEENKCALFHPRDSIDTMKILFWYFENLKEIRSLSMDSIREYFGMSSEGAHNAKVDVLDTAKILVRFLKFTRKYSSSAKFKNSFGG